MIISRTPVRISFFGGGTDYREYYKRKGGAVLGTTINKYVYVSLNQLISDFFEYKIRVAYSKSELVNLVEDIVHPSVRECLKLMKSEGNLDIHIFSDLPAKTGLGTSSSFTVGFLNTLYAMKGKIVTKRKLAEEALHVEQEMIGENVGSQDQVHAAFGGFNVIEYDANGFKVRPVIITKEKKAYLQSCLMVFYTGINRFASDILQEQIDNTKQQATDAHLDRIHQMVFEAEHLISESTVDDMVTKLGALLHEGWELKKRLSTKVSNTTTDEAYATALKAGAYGGKLCGAGGGGFLALLVSPEKQQDVRKALPNLKEVQFRFEDEGSSIIYLD